MTAMVDEFADVEDDYGFLIQNAQWATSIVAGGMARSSGEELKETMARLENAAWYVGIARDRGYGTVTIDADGDAVVNYALTDEVDTRIAHRSLEAQIRLHAAAGAQEIVPFAATTRSVGAPATTSTSSSPRCNASQWVRVDTGCSLRIR